MKLIITAPKNIATDFFARQKVKGYQGEIVADGKTVTIKMEKENDQQPAKKGRKRRKTGSENQ